MMTGTEIIERTDIKKKHLPLWHVIFINDDFHSMQFVTFVIINVFKLPIEEAILKMLEVHENGQSIIVTVHKERAELYFEQVSSIKEGIIGPVNCKIEPAP